MELYRCWVPSEELQPLTMKPETIFPVDQCKFKENRKRTEYIPGDDIPYNASYLQVSISQSAPIPAGSVLSAHKEV